MGDAEEARILRHASRKGAGGVTSPLSARLRAISSPRGGGIASPPSSGRLSNEMSALKRQKQNTAGLVGRGTRELEELRKQIKALQEKEAALAATLQTRTETLAQITQEMEDLAEKEASEAAATDAEINARAQKRREEQQKLLDLRREQERERLALQQQEAHARGDSGASGVRVQQSTSSTLSPPSSSLPLSSTEKEEIRLARQLERIATGGVGALANQFSPRVAQESVPLSAYEQEQKEKREEARREREAKRKVQLQEIQERREREIEETRRKEAEEKERLAQMAAEKGSILQKLLEQPGIPTKISYQCFDFDDDEIFVVGDFSNWVEVPMTRGDDLDLEVTIPLTPGTYHYYIRHKGKPEIDKTKATGFKNGILCQRLDV
eukprot:TRINITY_DN422_c2_g1_i1.p1 TRINITY_DN422_c2_g1~~TRINITY_DN422_c2_g1_i1.p1  ORF type:complete len:418 (-),score=122.68 TRINITY_DN422_c2_g1_i1:134-1279(-)